MSDFNKGAQRYEQEKTEKMLGDLSMQLTRLTTRHNSYFTVSQVQYYKRMLDNEALTVWSKQEEVIHQDKKEDSKA